MELHRLPLPPLGANCYLIKNGDQGLIVDPGGSSETVITACTELGFTPAAILLTHGHFDHVGAVGELVEHWPELPVYCHVGDVSGSPGQFTWLKGPTWKSLTDDQVLDLAGLSVTDRKSTRLNSSHCRISRMPSSA